MKCNLININRAAKKLAAAQNRCRVRIVSLEMLYDITDNAEAELAKLGLAKNQRPGAVAVYNWGALPNSYKYDGEGTKVVLVRRSSGWDLESATRSTLGLQSGGSASALIVRLSIAQQALIVRVNPFTDRYTENLTEIIHEQIGRQLLAHLRNLPVTYRGLPEGLRRLLKQEDYRALIDNRKDPSPQSPPPSPKSASNLEPQTQPAGSKNSLSALAPNLRMTGCTP